MISVAALFVEKEGVYFGVEGVDPWDEARDARLYAGPDPVVGHPPCQRWGRYWGGGPSHHKSGRFKLGDDSGCFRSCLESVRRFGGVLEHPEASHAWAHHGLVKPPKSGGWVPAGDGVGWTSCVEQGHYGHPARKATWLYACHVCLPDLLWGPCSGAKKLEDGFHSIEERRAARAAGVKPVTSIPKSQRSRTPIAFRDLLISIARTAQPSALETL